MISENDFLISKNGISDIKKFNIWYKKILTIFWYQKIEFLISENHLIKKNRAYFLIFFDIRKSISLFSDIKNSNSWYQKIYFLISENTLYFLISRNSFSDIKTMNSWYQTRCVCETLMATSRSKVKVVRLKMLVLTERSCHKEYTCEIW